MIKKYSRKDIQDKFYTNKEFAKKLINDFIDFSKFKLIIEPSAGDGAFSDFIPKSKRLAFDINPHADYIIKQDFLEWKCNGNIPSSHILCLGNPPFGKQGNLALQFIKHCMSMADTVAFILPPSFIKPSIQNKIPFSFHIDKEINLNKDAFLFEGQPYDVPAIFQVWNKKDKLRKKVLAVKPVGYSYVKKENANMSIRRVGFYAGMGFDDLDKCGQSHYLIKLNDFSKITYVIENLNKIKWKHNNTVGPRSISKQELNPVLNKIIKENL